MKVARLASPALAKTYVSQAAFTSPMLPRLTLDIILSTFVTPVERLPERKTIIDGKFTTAIVKKMMAIYFMNWK